MNKKYRLDVIELNNILHKYHIFFPKNDHRQ